MSGENLLTSAAGIGLFLFSLRYLNAVLQRTIARRLRPAINSMLSSNWRCLLIGVAMTALVQASSITIVASMGLLTSGLITLQQGWYLMLGATIGTTFKAWIFAGGFPYAPWLIAAAMALRLSGRQPARRETADVLLAMGLCFLGLSTLATGLTPILSQPWVQGMLAGLGTQNGVAGEIVPIVIGCLLAIAVQSSSAMVIMTITLAGQGLLSLTTGAALILGMNIGTTSTELLACTEAGKEARALAYGHCLIKIAGVLMVLLVFPFYLGLLDAGITLVAPQASLALRLAIFHTVFNIGNGIVWTVLGGPAVAYLKQLGGPSRSPVGLPLVVRKILSQAPDLAAVELERQLTNLLHLMKLVQDRWLARLMTGGTRQSSRDDSFAALEETLGDLLFGLSRRGEEVEQPTLLRALDILGCCQQLFATWQLVGEHVDRTEEGDHSTLPAALHQVVEQTVARWDQIWLQLLYPDRSPISTPAVRQDLLAQYLSYCRDQHGLTAESARWLLETVGLLSSLDASMGQLETLSRRPAPALAVPHAEVEMESYIAPIVGPEEAIV